MRHFGKRLQRIRAAKGLSQKELAHKAGLSLSYVSKTEQGRTNPSLCTIEQLAQALGVEISTLLDGLEEESSSGCS